LFSFEQSFDCTDIIHQVAVNLKLSLIAHWQYVSPSIVDSNCLV